MSQIPDISFKYQDIDMKLPTLDLSKSNVRNSKTNSDPLKWSPELGNQLLSFFLKIRDEENLLYLEDIPFGEPLRTEIRRLLIAIYAYEKHSKKQVLSRWDILSGNAEGHSFSKELKEFRIACFIRTFRGKEFVKENTKLRWNVVPLKGIDDIFNYQHCINWEEPDEQDYKYGFLDLKQDEEYLVKFRKIISEILPEKTFPIVDEREVLLELSSSAAKVPNQLKTSKNWKLKKLKNTFSESIGQCLRCIVPVHPQGWRDTVILEPSSLNTVKLIDQQTLYVLQEMPGHIMLKSEKLIRHRINNFYRKNRTYIMRDIKKEGITKPRNLLKIILEELFRKYKLKAFERTEFYEDFCLIIENQAVYPKRGNGLGMANALTTLMQIGIMELIKQENDPDGLPFYDIDYLCINDDIVISVPPEDAERYWDAEHIVLESLGIIRNNKKSFCMDNAFVLAEKYITPIADFNDKLYYQAREFLNAFAAVNVTHAKSLVQSSVHMVDSRITRLYIGKIISFFGYEFFPDEYKYPSYCGGWYTSTIGGVDLGYLILEELDYNKLVYASFKACLENKVYIHKRENNLPYDIFSNVFGNLEIPLEYQIFFNIGTTSDLQKKYQRTSENHSTMIYAWNGLQRRRRKIFKEIKDGPSFEDFLRDIRKSYPLKDFYPLEFMVESREYYRQVKGRYRDLYQSHKPLVSALMSWNPMFQGDEIPEVYSLHFTKTLEITKQTSSEIRKRIKEFVFEKVIDFQGNLSTYFTYLTDKTKWVDFCRSYINPQGVGAAFSLIDPTARIPLLKEEWRSPLIIEKEKVFGTFLSDEEELFYQRFYFDRKLIKEMHELYIKSGMTFRDYAIMWETHYREYRQGLEKSVAFTEDQGPKDLQTNIEEIYKPLEFKIEDDETLQELLDIIEDGNPEDGSLGGSESESSFSPDEDEEEDLIENPDSD
jgi:hypothetical protein